MSAAIARVNALRRAQAEDAGKDTFRLDVIETWPACVRCGSWIRWTADTTLRGLYRRCSCPGVLWRCVPDGWERVDPEPAGAPSTPEEGATRGAM